jgi:hypothetical protein
MTTQTAYKIGMRDAQKGITCITQSDEYNDLIIPKGKSYSNFKAYEDGQKQGARK